VKIADEMNTKISDYFDQALHFIESSISKNSSNRILVHYEAKISRSATIFIVYLMQFHNKFLKSAYEFVKQCKKNVTPNINFFQELIQFEKQLNDKNNHFIPSISLSILLFQNTSSFILISY
jgi:protein-tyrosine phosphatase